jgi:hypothetical protein
MLRRLRIVRRDDVLVSRPRARRGDASLIVRRVRRFRIEGDCDPERRLGRSGLAVDLARREMPGPDDRLDLRAHFRQVIAIYRRQTRDLAVRIEQERPLDFALKRLVLAGMRHGDERRQDDEQQESHGCVPLVED